MNERSLLSEWNNYKNGNKIHPNIYTVPILCCTKFYICIRVHTHIFFLSLYKDNVFIIHVF